MAATLEQADRMLTRGPAPPDLSDGQLAHGVVSALAHGSPPHRGRGHWAIVAAHLARRPLRPRRIGAAPTNSAASSSTPNSTGPGLLTTTAGTGPVCASTFWAGRTASWPWAGRLLKTHLPVDDNGIMVLRYPQALCRLEMSWTEAVPHVPPHDVVLYGTEGTMVVGDKVTVHTRENREGTEAELDELSASLKAMPPRIFFTASARASRPKARPMPPNRGTPRRLWKPACRRPLRALK